ncbi:related to 3-phosphoinositide dependent protein kinase-1 (PDK1) [Cephalotrichum gorgonifer]|uniref:non-specific serine/threonine protein kinase n=1 Tax=Cephalotrichum gorgonifer TaxID=2041049 RepID=A0AAE8STG3_9PEZI|nr:related to 3-phosphoinositide dependent protein kinase-1 (PDK1) [Cephalotrichum gorgonifer]
MSGDLSLSQALGGLRIANPDDAPPNSPDAPILAKHTEPATDDRPIQHENPQEPPSYPQVGGQAVARQGHHATPSQDTRGHVREASSASRLRQSALDALYAHNNNMAQSPAPRSSRNAPSSGTAQDPGLSNQPSRAHGSYRHRPQNSASWEPSQSDGPQNPSPGGRNLPPRGSSRGMAGGYVGGNQAAHPPQDYGPEMPLPTSSQEWQERGAAVGVRREVDANGQTVIRHVKKGVRDFSFGRVLGEGSYSTVYLATDRQTLKEYAIKVLEKKHIIKEKKIKYVNIEKNTLNRLTEHPGIVRLYYTFQDEASLYYVIDYCSGGELLGALKRTGTFDVECARFYGAQILDAVEYMHSRGVIHRDLKPENVLLDDHMHIKITDFGTAKMLADPRAGDGRDGGGPDGQSRKVEDGRARSFVGTAEYVSPELLTNKSSCKASDLWAFGCIVYQLIAGRPPFKGGSEYLTFQKIVGLDYEFPPGFPPAARDLVERLLVLDPSQRLTIEHIKNHEFFDGCQFGKALWRTKAPRLRPYVPPAQDPHIIQLNGQSGASTAVAGPRGHSAPHRPAATPNSTVRHSLVITELPPPTQLDFEWSSVLTRPNERILKLGDLMVISAPLSHITGKGGEHNDGHKKLSRFFGGSTTKKRQRLVMVTSSGRIILAPAGGEEKRAKQDISLVSSDCAWKSHIDAKGQPVWCVDTGGTHYTFEEPRSASGASVPASGSVDEWLEALERAREMAISQNIAGSSSNDNDFGDMSSRMSSPASTLGGGNAFSEGFTISDKSGRNHLSKSQAGGGDGSSSKMNRFSKRQSKSGLGSAF